MADTAAAHEILRDAWGDVKRFDRYALGVLAALVAAPSPAPSREELAAAAGVPRALVDYAIDELDEHGYVERLRVAAPHLAVVFDEVHAPEPDPETQRPASPEPARVPQISLEVRRTFSIATDAVLEALDALEDAPLALEGPSLEALQRTARARLSTRSGFTGSDLDNLAAVVANHIWAHADEDPEIRRRKVLETVPRLPLNCEHVLRPHLYRLGYGQSTPERVLAACRSIFAEANEDARRLGLETAVSPQPLTAQQLESAAVEAAERIEAIREKRRNNPYAGATKRQKPAGRRS